jgi:predicted phosphodiesterase
VDKYLFITDIHYPYQDKKTIEIALKVQKDLKINNVIFGGDNWDADGISKFTAKDSDEGLITTYNEMTKFKERIFDKFTGKKYLMLGNHDGQRLKDYLRRHLERGNNELYNYWNEKFNFKKVFNCEVFDYNDILKIGSLHFIHGERHNKYHANSHFEIIMGNVMYGHLHTTQIYTRTTKINEPYQAISVPGACQLNPDYMKNRASSWINGFAVINFHKDCFWYDICQIINGMTIINGKIYK